MPTGPPRTTGTGGCTVGCGRFTPGTSWQVLQPNCTKATLPLSISAFGGRRKADAEWRPELHAVPASANTATMTILERDLMLHLLRRTVRCAIPHGLRRPNRASIHILAPLVIKQTSESENAISENGCQ